MRERVVRCLSHFGRNEDAAVSIQIILFGIVLLGASGLVIDLGKVYSAHSQQQYFTDQVALSGAAELDGTTGAIERARDAMALVGKSSGFIAENDGAFAINENEVVFLSDLTLDSKNRIDIAASLQHQTSSDADARYVYLAAEPATVDFSLLRILGMTDDGALTSSQVKSYAVAKREQQVCNEVTTLVMCNPFEGSNTNFKEFFSAADQGRQFQITLDGAMTFDPQDGIVRMGLLNNPVADPFNICIDPNLVPAIPGEDPIVSRDRCLMAMSRSYVSCLGDQVSVKPMSPDVMTAGLNTVFDIWDDPLDQILTSDPVVPNTIYNRSDFIQPDQVTTKGMMRINELSPLVLSIVQALGIMQLSEPHSGRLNHTASSNLKMWRDTCFEDGDCPYPAISNVANASHSIEYFQTNYASYREAQGWVQWPQEYVTATRHDAYMVEHENPDLWDYMFVPTETAEPWLYADIVDYDGGPGADPDGDGFMGVDDADYVGYPVQHHEILLNDVQNRLINPNADKFRRMQNITVVNCAAATTDPVTGKTSAEVVDVVKLLMSEPINVSACEGGAAAATCPTEDIAEAQYYGEYISKASDETDDEEVLSYSVLVD